MRAWIAEPGRTRIRHGGDVANRVTSPAVLSRWRPATPCGPEDPAAGALRSQRLRVGALALGTVATVMLGILGCTTVTDGTATVDTAMAPAYRASVSASVSASSATSRLRESQRQQSLTTRAVHSACESLATSSAAAIDKVNAYVEANNQGRAVAPTEGPAVDALNHTADVVAGSVSDALSSGLREALNAWVDAARSVANAIRTHASPSEFNRRVDQLNDTKTKALKLCVASY